MPGLPTVPQQKLAVQYTDVRIGDNGAGEQGGRLHQLTARGDRDFLPLAPHAGTPAFQSGQPDGLAIRNETSASDELAGTCRTVWGFGQILGGERLGPGIAVEPLPAR